jgi:hypothetical protein
MAYMPPGPPPAGPMPPAGDPMMGGGMGAPPMGGGLIDPSIVLPLVAPFAEQQQQDQQAFAGALVSEFAMAVEMALAELSRNAVNPAAAPVAGVPGGPVDPMTAPLPEEQVL